MDFKQIETTKHFATSLGNTWNGQFAQTKLHV